MRVPQPIAQAGRSIACALAVGFGAVAICGAPGPGGVRAAEADGADFATMADCLAFMRHRSGGPLAIATDMAHEVSGRFADGSRFACERRGSGAKTFSVRGWHMI